MCGGGTPQSCTFDTVQLDLCTTTSLITLDWPDNVIQKEKKKDRCFEAQHGLNRLLLKWPNEKKKINNSLSQLNKSANSPEMSYTPGNRLGVLVYLIYCIMVYRDGNREFYKGFIEQKYTKSGNEKEMVSGWRQGSVNKHQIHFLQKPQKTQPCVIQDTDVDLCGLPPLTKQTRLCWWATVTKPWALACKLPQQSNTKMADSLLCSGAHVQHFISSPCSETRAYRLHRRYHEPPHAGVKQNYCGGFTFDTSRYLCVFHCLT